MSARCAVCRAEFPSAKGFHRRPVGKGRFDLLCPGCCQRQTESAFHFALAVFVAMTVAGIVLFHTSAYGCILLFFGAVFLSWIVTVLPHELAHALAALAVGMRLFTVTIGVSDRILFVRQVFGYDFVFRPILLGGHVLCSPKHLRWARLRDFMVVLAGPLADGFLIVVTMELLHRSSSEEVVYWVLTGFLYGCIIQLVIGFFPRKAWFERNRIPNDGLLLLTIPFMSQESIRAWHSATFYLEAMESLQRDNIQDAERWLAKGMEVYPDNSWGLVVQASILHHQHRYAEARDVYLRALNQPDWTPETKAYLWNNIAWLDLLIAAPMLLAEADQLSRQAVEELPWPSSVKETRGAVLIELGQIEEGVRFIEQALWENDTASSKALNACYLAIAMIRRGEKSKAREYIDEAERRDPDCPLIERAVREFGEREEETIRADHEDQQP